MSCLKAQFQGSFGYVFHYGDPKLSSVKCKICVFSCPNHTTCIIQSPLPLDFVEVFSFFFSIVLTIVIIRMKFERGSNILGKK